MHFFHIIQKTLYEIISRYCVFGDTVNIAMTMEGTSIAQKIQISESSYKLLVENFPNKFELEYRGVNPGADVRLKSFLFHLF